MPKQTFFNLSEKKKHKIIDAAYNEFSSHVYSDASVNRIIKQSGIAVGSFYQYFENLQDLYYYIIKLLIEKKHQFIKEELSSLNNRDFENVLKTAYKGSMKFALSDPRFLNISNHFLQSNNKKIFSDIQYSDENVAVEDDIKILVEQAIKNGEIKSMFSAEFIMNLITSTTTLLINELLTTKKKKLSESDYNHIADTAIHLLMNGIKEVPNDSR